MTPMTADFPGHSLPGLSERLKSMGVYIGNNQGGDAVRRDGDFLTGESPKESNELWKLAVKILLAEWN